MRATPFILSRYLFLSWINKKKYKQGSAISVLIPILGVAIGVFAFVVVISVMSGFVQNIKKSILQFEPHITIISIKNNQQLTYDNSLPKLLIEDFTQIKSVNPFQKTEAILQTKNRASIATLNGINTSNREKLNLERFLNSKTHLSDLNSLKPSLSIESSNLFPTVILGVDLMNDLNLRIGDTLTLVSPNFDDTADGISPIQFPVVVAGYINSGNFSFDKKLILSSIETANSFLGIENKIIGYHAFLTDPMNAEKVAKELNIFLKNKNLKAIPWTEKNRAFLKALTLEHYGMSLVLGMIILVGCFSITISLLLSIRRKSKEMAILRSIGYEKKSLSYLYLWQGFILGLCGIIIGLLFAFITLYLIHNYSIPFITSSYSSEPLPISVNYTDLSLVILGSLFLSMLAAVWPAYEIKNLNVVEILSIRN
jgi:lipoprotein-releasing system permease protein